MSETELVVRLERLERAHRRLKGFAVTGLLLVTALATIYATQPAPRRSRHMSLTSWMTQERYG